MRIAIYARKSTESEDRQVQSLEDQIRELTVLAKREHLIVSEVFQEARSAKEPDNRPEFQRLVTAIQGGTVDAVLTWSINRLSRNAVDGGMVAHLLQTGRLAFIRTIERTYRPEDNALLLSIENGMAIAYLQDLRRNVMRGMKGKVERGWHTCKAPIGYLNDPETRHILPDPDRFVLVRKAWDMALQGESVAGIHRKMVNLGLTIRVRSKNNRPISRARLYTMLHDQFYIGMVRFKGELYAGKHTPMVTSDEYQAVQEALGDANKSTKEVKRSLAFAGALRCEKCGCGVVGEEKTKVYPKTNRTAIYTYYHCTGSRGCAKRSINGASLRQKAEEHLECRYVTESVGDWLKDALVESLERETCDTASELSRLDAKEETLSKRLNELTIMRSDGEISPHEYADIRAQTLERVSAVRLQADNTRNLAARIIRLVNQRIDAAIAAGEITRGEDNSAALGRVLRSSGPHYLNLDAFELRLDPILEKITTFEPPRDNSESPKRGDLLPLNSVWWSLVEELRTAATDQIARNDFLDAQMSVVERGVERRREYRLLHFPDDDEQGYRRAT